MAKSKSIMEQVAGTSKLRINQTVDSDQLLVKLCRNGKEWLSPVGWVKEEKGTLLDCSADADHAVLEIPEKFAKNLKSGDVVTLSRPDSGFKSKVKWGQAAGSAATLAASGQKAKKANGSAPVTAVSVSEVSLADTEKRAKEAAKAAADYKAKMEAAEKAREAAQTTALEAARKADEALKAEADRIAEMERAAKAFEEAERLRLDEERRLTRERRLEDERIAEEARRVEEARMKAEAERLKQERLEARKFFNTEISTTQDEKTRLEEVLAGFKSKTDATETEIETNEKRIKKLEKALASAQKEEANNKASLAKEKLQIGELQTRHQQLGTSAKDLEKSHEKLFKNLEKAEAAHLKAQSDVDAAKARAAETLQALNTVKVESDKAKSRQDETRLETQELAAKITGREKHISELKTAHDTARLAVEKEQTDLKARTLSRDTLAQKLTGAKTDIARTLQDIRSVDESLAQKKNALKQLEDIQNADEIRLLTGNSSKPERIVEKSKSPPKVPEPAEKGGFLGRFFRKAGSDDLPAENTKTDTTVKSTLKAENPSPAAEPSPALSPVLKAPGSASRENGRGATRLNSWLLLGIAAAGIALVGTGYAFNSKSEQGSLPKTVLKETPKIKNTVLVAETVKTTAPILSLTDTNFSPEPVAAKSTGPKTEVSKAEAPKAELQPAEEPVKNTSVIKEVSVKKAAPSKQATEKATQKAAKQAATKSPGNSYVKVTTEVQEKLAFLGMYDGEINGLQTRQTQKSMQAFQTLFGLPADNDITGAFLNTLNRAIQDQKELTILTEVSPRSTPIVQVADNTGFVEFLAPQPDLSQPLSITNKAEQVQSAELTVPSTAIEAPIVKDIIVPAKVTRKARIEYPQRVLRDDKRYNAAVIVSYDVMADGSVINPKVKEIDYDGKLKYKAYFERAAIKAVKRQAFAPRTVNGEPVIEKGRATRISFNHE